MTNNETLISQCPHCYGKLEFEVRSKFNLDNYRDGAVRNQHMSIVTVTPAKPNSEAFLLHMRHLADDLGAELVIGYDTRYGIAGMELAHKYSDLTVLVKSKGYIESVLQDVIDASNGTWILRLDDDEMVTPAMWQWLKDRKYDTKETQSWGFAEATLWPTTMTFISSHPFWPDVHPRLQTWKYAKWGRAPHSGPTHGPGLIAPAAIAHHKLLVKSLDERRHKWEERDKGRDRDEIHAIMNMPEEYLKSLTVYPLGDGGFENPSLVKGMGETIHLTPPTNDGTVGVS